MHSHGPHIELYLAEEAIGLVRSLDWDVAKGPLWKENQEEENRQMQNDMKRQYLQDDDTNNLTTEGDEERMTYN